MRLISILTILVLFSVIFAQHNGQGSKPNDSINDLNEDLETLVNATENTDTAPELNGWDAATNSNGKGPNGADNNQTNSNVNGNNEKNQSNGISEQVHSIIEQRKNGSLTVPQGMLVRIEAHNHVLNLANETEIELNESLEVKLHANGKNKTLLIKPHPKGVNITDENVTVETNETLEIEDDEIVVENETLNVLPSDLPEMIRTTKIKSAVLKVSSNNPTYFVNATRQSKVLWLFNADMDVEVTVDGQSGEKTEKRPWWSFLASVD